MDKYIYIYTYTPIHTHIYNRVRSMRMGFFVQRFLSGANLCTHRGLPKIYQGFGARDSRLLLWKPIKKIEDPPFQNFTVVPVTYKFSSFHWSPHNLQVFTGFPEFSVSTEVNGSPARRNLSIFSANLCMYKGLPP